MNRNRNILVYFLLLHCCIASAQLSKNYFPLKSYGAIPEAIASDINKIIADDVKNLSAKCTPEKKLENEKQLAQDYFLKNLLLDGKILFNDSVGLYVNKVADELFKNDKTLRNQLHFYVTKFSSVGGYGFNKGYVFINVGLLAQFENEGQLAAMLAHLVGHITLKHTTLNFMNDEMLQSNHTQNTFEAELNENLNFTDKQETAADSVEVELMKKSAYTLKSIDDMLTVLEYAYLPFDDKKFDKSFLENKNLTLPDTLYLKKTKEINTLEANKVQRAWVSKLVKRQATMQEETLNDKKEGGKTYTLPPVKFLSAREQARFELCRSYFLDQDYVEAIYASYLLLKKYPENIYLKEIVSKSLYNNTLVKTDANRYANNVLQNIPDEYKLKEFDKSIVKYDDVEGNSQRLYYMFSEMTSKEMNVVALSYVWNAHLQNPTNEVFNLLTDSLLMELTLANGMRESDFQKFTKAELVKNDSLKKSTIATDQAANNDEEQSKYATIKSHQLEKEIVTDANFTRYAFVDYFKDKDFVKRFDKALSIKRATKKNISSPQNDKQKTIVTAASLNLEKVVFVNPYYKKYTKANGATIMDFDDRDADNSKFIALLKKNADLNKVKYDFICSNAFTSTDVDKYNDNAILNDWLFERMNNGEDGDAIVLNTDEVKKLSEKYGTPYFVFTGIRATKSDQSKTVYFFMVCNIVTGEIKLYDVHSDNYVNGVDSFTYLVSKSILKVSGNTPK